MVGFWRHGYVGNVALTRRASFFDRHVCLEWLPPVID
jgi:hypothetical protein